VAFSPQANSKYWATAAGRRILVPTFADRNVSGDKPSGPPRPLISVLLDRGLIYPQEAEWTPFQTHCFSESNPGPLGLWPATLTTGIQRRSLKSLTAINCSLLKFQWHSNTTTSEWLHSSLKTMIHISMLNPATPWVGVYLLAVYLPKKQVQGSLEAATARWTLHFCSSVGIVATISSSTLSRAWCLFTSLLSVSTTTESHRTGA
jgi:hypothetical protein